MSELHLHQSDQLIKIIYAKNKFRIKTVTKLANITRWKWWIALDTDAFLLHKSRAIQE